jgi:hypothetical protein
MWARYFTHVISSQYHRMDSVEPYIRTKTTRDFRPLICNRRCNTATNGWLRTSVSDSLKRQQTDVYAGHTSQRRRHTEPTGPNGTTLSWHFRNQTLNNRGNEVTVFNFQYFSVPIPTFHTQKSRTFKFTNTTPIWEFRFFLISGTSKLRITTGQRRLWKNSSSYEKHLITANLATLHNFLSTEVTNVPLQ